MRAHIYDYDTDRQCTVSGSSSERTHAKIGAGVEVPAKSRLNMDNWEETEKICLP